MKKAFVFIFFIALILVFVLIFSYEKKISKYEESISKFERQIEVAGAIRCTGNQRWFAISDEVHVPINIDRIEVKNGAIVVYYTFTASRIHMFIVTPDETFSRAGFFAGASVGRDRAVINISKVIDGQVVRIDPSEIESKVGNFWIYGLFTE
jgi:hypothetical protein